MSLGADLVERSVALWTGNIAEERVDLFVARIESTLKEFTEFIA